MIEKRNIPISLPVTGEEEWQALKAKAVEMKKTEFADRLHEVDDKLKLEYAKIEQKIHEHNDNLKIAFRSIGYKDKAA